jgi:hypothetical protein
VSAPLRSYAGCTCAFCGVQWPATPPATGEPVFCDGLCESAARTGADATEAGTPRSCVPPLAVPVAPPGPAERVPSSMETLTHEFVAAVRRLRRGRRSLRAVSPPDLLPEPAEARAAMGSRRVELITEALETRARAAYARALKDLPTVTPINLTGWDRPRGRDL